MTWEGLTDGLDAHLNTFMSYLPHTMVVGRRLLLRARLCWSCPGLRIAQPGGPPAWVSVPPLFTWRRKKSQLPKRSNFIKI
jgi:hypothetical protein